MRISASAFLQPMLFMQEGDIDAMLTIWGLLRARIIFDVTIMIL